MNQPTTRSETPSAGTQYEGHGPGAELLGTPRSALELGCGRGNAVAALALTGIDVTGVDISATQWHEAVRRWSHIPTANFLNLDVVEFLANTDQQWDAVYSIWGALWFVAPETWIPLVRKRLTSQGRLVFAHAPAVPGSYGAQGTYGDGFTGRQVWVYRYAFSPADWTARLTDHGFTEINAHVHPAPDPANVGTLIIEATVGAR